MKLTSDSGEFKRTDFNMTPMIDVCFQLLIFFMLTLKVLATEGDFDIRMPIAAPSEGKPEDQDNPPMVVRLKAGPAGQLSGIVLTETPMKNFTELRNKIRSICESRGNSQTLEVEFDCDYTLRYEYVVDAITAVSGYVGDDGKSIIKLVEKIKFKPPRGGPVE